MVMTNAILSELNSLRAIKITRKVEFEIFFVEVKYTSQLHNLRARNRRKDNEIMSFMCKGNLAKYAHEDSKQSYAKSFLPFFYV